jgi:hypothetical protein
VAQTIYAHVSKRKTDKIKQKEEFPSIVQAMHKKPTSNIIFNVER